MATRNGRIRPEGRLGSLRGPAVLLPSSSTVGAWSACKHCLTMLAFHFGDTLLMRALIMYTYRWYCRCWRWGGWVGAIIMAVPHPSRTGYTSSGASRGCGTHSHARAESMTRCRWVVALRRTPTWLRLRSSRLFGGKTTAAGSTLGSSRASVSARCGVRFWLRFANAVLRCPLAGWRRPLVDFLINLVWPALALALPCPVQTASKQAA